MSFFCWNSPPACVEVRSVLSNGTTSTFVLGSSGWNGRFIGLEENWWFPRPRQKHPTAALSFPRPFSMSSENTKRPQPPVGYSPPRSTRTRPEIRPPSESGCKRSWREPDVKRYASTIYVTQMSSPRHKFLYTHETIIGVYLQINDILLAL